MAHAMTVSPEAMAYFEDLKAKGEIQGEWLDKLSVADLSAPESAFPLASAEVAALANVGADWVRKLAREMPEHLARKIGGEWRFSDSAARWISDRPDNRGRKADPKNWVAPEDRPWQNPLEAVLSADLPIDIAQAAEELIADRGREQWAEDIAQGISRAVHISERHMGQLLECENVTRWNRAVEAIAKRRELTPAQAERLIEIAPDDRFVARYLAQKAASDPDFPRDVAARIWERARQMDAEWHSEAFS